MLDFTMEDAGQAGPNGRTGEAQSRELDNTDVKQPKNVGDVEFTDAADRAVTAHTHTTTSDNTSRITICCWSTKSTRDRGALSFGR